MKDQQSYFEKADFQSNLPKQFLIMFFGIFLVLVEVGLAQWPFFHGSSPLISLIFMYFIMIFKGNQMFQQHYKIRFLKLMYTLNSN